MVLATFWHPFKKSKMCKKRNFFHKKPVLKQILNIFSNKMNTLYFEISLIIKKINFS